MASTGGERPPDDAGPGGDRVFEDLPAPKKRALQCKTCGKIGHARTSSKDCDFYQPRSSVQAKQQVKAAAEQAQGGVDIKTAPTTIKTSLNSAVPHESFKFAAGSLAIDFTMVCIPAADLIKVGAQSFVELGNTLPELDQSLLRRIFFLVAAGEPRIHQSESLARQLPLLRHLEREWLVNSGGGPGLRLSYPRHYLGNPAGGEDLPLRMFDTYISNEINDIFNQSFAPFETSIREDLRKTVNRNFVNALKQGQDLLPWDEVRDLADGSAFPTSRKPAIHGAIFRAAHSRRLLLQFFSPPGGVAFQNMPDGGYMTEARIRQAVQANGPGLVYEFKTPAMPAAKRYSFTVPFLRAVLDLVERFQDLYVQMKGEFGVWFEEEFDAIGMPSVTQRAKQLVKDAIMAHVTGEEDRLELGEHDGLNRAHIITRERLTAAAQAGTVLSLQYRNTAGILVFKTITAEAVRKLHQFVQDGINRFNLIVENGMAGAPGDWNRLVRFIVQTNTLIRETFRPPPPPDPLPANYNAPLPKCSPILPEYSYMTKYVHIASTAGLRNFINRHRRLFPDESRIFFETYFANGFSWDSKEDVDELWEAVFSPKSLINRNVGMENEKTNYPNRMRVFRKHVSTDGEGASYLFEKFVSARVLQAEQPAQEELDEDDEKAQRQEEARRLYERDLRAKLDEVAELKRRAERGEIILREQAIDPGIASMVTEVRETGEFDVDGTPLYKTWSYSPKRFHAEAGYTKRRDKMNEAARTPNEAFGPDPALLAGAPPRSVNDINNGTPSKRLTAIEDVRARARYRLRHLDLLVLFYSDFRGARFENYRGKQQTVERMANEIIGMEDTKPDGAPRTALSAKDRNYARRERQLAKKFDPPPDQRPVFTVIVLGTAKTGSMPWVKGHLRGPMKLIMKTVDGRPCTVLLVIDEFNTSKVHHRCLSKSLDTRECVQMKEMETWARVTTAWHPPFVLPPDLAVANSLPATTWRIPMAKPAWHPPMSIPTKQPWLVAMRRRVETVERAADGPWTFLCRGVRWCFAEGCNMAMVNRDVNAAINILKVYQRYLHQLMTTGTFDISDRPGDLRRPG